MLLLLLLLCAPCVPRSVGSRQCQVSARTLHCGLKSLWISPLTPITSKVWCMRQEEVRQGPLPCAHETHLGPRGCHSLRVAPGVMRRCSLPLPFSEIGTLLLPGESKLPENAYFLSWAVVSLKVFPRHLKDFSLWLASSGVAGTVGDLQLQARVWSSPGQCGSSTKIRLLWEDIASDKPTESQVQRISPPSASLAEIDSCGARVWIYYRLSEFFLLLSHSLWMQTTIPKW